MSETKDRHLHDIIFGRVIMPNEGKRGYTKDIWEGACMQLGPVYGPQSKNLINFVSSQEVKSLENIDLLSRNTMANQHSPSSSKASLLPADEYCIRYWVEWATRIKIQSFCDGKRICSKHK